MPTTQFINISTILLKTFSMMVAMVDCVICHFLSKYVKLSTLHSTNLSNGQKIVEKESVAISKLRELKAPALEI